MSLKCVNSIGYGSTTAEPARIWRINRPRDRERSARRSGDVGARSGGASAEERPSGCDFCLRRKLTTRAGKILAQDPAVATGAGHHSVVRGLSGKWYIVYHRRPLGETDRNHRVTCIDEMRFGPNGEILPVIITNDGVAADPLTAR